MHRVDGGAGKLIGVKCKMKKKFYISLIISNYTINRQHAVNYDIFYPSLSKALKQASIMVPATRSACMLER